MTQRERASTHSPSSACIRQHTSHNLHTSSYMAECLCLCLCLCLYLCLCLWLWLYLSFRAFNVRGDPLVGTLNRVKAGWIYAFNEP